MAVLSNLPMGATKLTSAATDNPIRVQTQRRILVMSPENGISSLPMRCRLHPTTRGITQPVHLSRRKAMVHLGYGVEAIRVGGGRCAQQVDIFDKRACGET